MIWIAATPIGNLEDVTQRLLRLMKECDVICAEDTRHSLKLLNALEIKPNELKRLDAHASEKDLSRIVQASKSGQNVLVITDAGTPGISDPAAALVKMASKTSAFSLVCAMAALGVESDLVEIKKLGSKPILLAAALWVWLTVGGLGAARFFMGV